MSDQSRSHDRPVVLVFAGHDPTGGAGIQADIESLASQGCHAATVITALTVQNTQTVHEFHAVDPGLAIDQANSILADLPIAAIKIGMVGTREMAHAIHTILVQHPDLPVILDPVLRGGGGGSLSDPQLTDAIREELLPIATLATPNSLEARQLSALDNPLSDCANKILAAGCRGVLVTGTHESDDDVVHTLYRPTGGNRVYRCPRLPGEFHGSGCTLSSAIAGRIARGETLEAAVTHAQEYTWSTLRHAIRPGKGQQLPDRFYWHPNPGDRADV